MSSAILSTTESAVANDHPSGLWGRLPVLLRAILAGLAVTSGAIQPWAVLASWNLRYPGWPYLPWSVPVTAAWLVLFACYLNGWGWPRRTAAARRRDFRARHLSARIWRHALGTGALGWLTTAGVFFATLRVVPTPAERPPGLSALPWSTVVLVVLMASAVAGFGEEAGFRGFLQAPLERRYGPVAAILITGTLFGLGHASHASWSPWHMPVYLVMSAFVGAIAWRTGSILPCMLLHASLDPIYIAWMRRSDLPFVGDALWRTGLDGVFWALCLLALAAGAGTVLAFRRLGRAVDAEHAGAAGASEERFAVFSA